jgi:hypothetical protein
MSIQEIRFNPVNKLVETSIVSPKPARNYMPEWYKNIPAFRDGKFVDGAVDKTIKMCSPFADAFSFGYIQETWQDIEIKLEAIDDYSAKFNFEFKENPSIMDIRGKIENSFSIPDGFYDMELVWHPVWVPELPEGYSALITHPLNRVDLPFYTLSGVVEHDTYTYALEGSNLPFLIKKGFSGIIPKGTPMYQVIPFKRDDWKSKTKEYSEDAQFESNKNIRSHIFGGYKKLNWKKKNFE